MIQSKEYEDLVQKIKNVYCNELENENYANKDKLASLFEYWIKLFLLKNYILDKKKLFRYDNRSSIKVKKPYWKDIIQKIYHLSLFHMEFCQEAFKKTISLKSSFRLLLK